jgi:aminocarboxymuconate-semialdehyde decarboxylase
MLGSDYPFPLGEERIGRLVRETDRLAPAAKERILGLNARTFLGLD